MAKAVADSDSVRLDPKGFTTDGANITGVSPMHDSGTGGSPSLENFALFPFSSCSGDDVNGCTRKLHYTLSSVKATPGYYGLTLVNGIQAKMTSTHHVSLFRFTFPSTRNLSSPLILLDLTDFSDSQQDNGTVSVDPTTGRITGNARFLPSFRRGKYVAYVCAEFSGAAIRDTGIYADSRAKRIGISLISSAQACASAEAEISDFGFDATKTAAETHWREKISPLVVSRNEINDLSILRNFYSGIYRTMVNPQDYTWENPLWESAEPYFDSFYCIWDLFRSQMPFLIVLDPSTVARQVRSLIDTYLHLGWLPVCRMSMCKGFTQGVSNADVVLADAYIKGLQDGIDWDLGYEAAINDAEKEPFDYLSRTLEYSYNDFAISQIGTGLGERAADVEKYIARSGNWKNLFKADQTSFFSNETDTGYTGFFQPRYLNGTYLFQDVLKCSNIDFSDSVCSLQNTGAETFESSIWEYSFFVPRDQATLITTFGSPGVFVKRLDFLHDQGITYIGNEPSFLTVFQYHYAGRPALSALRSHFYIPKFFSPTNNGLPGNDDSGATGLFMAFAMMRLFPNPGQDVYLITPPYFESVNITSPIKNKTATIRNVNFDSSYKNIYIQNATLDGSPYTKNLIDHSFFTEGKELVLMLGSTESHWGTQIADLPPSLGTYVGTLD
ncbi:glycosyl hydrolase family 92-domain-containing protein [Calycina marina]|uniref:Glycosyl hydrolase family 92-domain-containing protein n=1 Tax=Calycina marina TaxID=1763456 RepID=A0A9P8CFF5_9HELO|nr:glycosyl hydrolase family 92-domain-containing protein [Calycina marina]